MQLDFIVWQIMAGDSTKYEIHDYMSSEKKYMYIAAVEWGSYT